MRRPTPLPPEEPRAVPPQPREPDDAEETRAEAPRDEGEPELFHAPLDASVLPFVAPAGRAPGAVGRPPAISGMGRPAHADAPTGGEVGVRDVWRASRARRRALRAEVRRFTVRQRRRRMLWLGVVVALVVLVAGTVGVAYSPLFAVHRVEVVGTSQLDPAAVGAALDDQIGTPLALVDESAVKAALVQFPLVESYTLEARPPNDLVVRVVERLPIGVISSSAGFTVVDAAGVALSTSPTAPAGLPVVDVTGGARSQAFRAAGQVMRSLPEGVRAQVTAVAASTPDDVSFTLGATSTRVVWGSDEQSAQKAVVLASLMAQRPPETVALYDVSSPDAPVVG